MRFEEMLVLATAVTGAVSLIFIKSRSKNKVIEYCRSFFPVLLIVLVLRSFLFEPFRIPSGSMKPTLLVGDFILVNKYKYGVRLPVLGTKIIPVGKPQTGDVIVFRGSDEKDLIKRVVGVPGDKISYKGKQLYINGKEVPTNFVKDTHDDGIYTVEKTEQLDTVAHEIYIYPGITRPYLYTDVTVPEGNYFVMGDNRDNSEDSRRFGFVAEDKILGRAIATWLSLGDWWKVRWSRIGNSI